GQTAPDGGDPERSPESEQAIGEFAMAMMELIAARRAEPRDDLVSVWLQATEPHGRPWTEAEIISEAILLLDGGAETTRTVIGAMIYELARNPAQRQLLLDGADMTVAVEEMIRWVTPILNMRRTATEDHELHGRQIKAGDELLLMYSSANRDEDVFDRPDELDLTRQHNNHVAFGFGTHFCLGSSLARIEIKVMFEELLRRIPDWRIAPGAEPKIIPATFTRAYDAVPIEFTPA
ncbi:MAG: cytochrome P450, partial [Acidimicrobiales bacterium]|nr:cytochrome P450 [Acidimicrobiales bacterium]